ncbi:MAG TPA: hypothetical protein VFB79_01675 [Candidatus Angelobacter sp.]|nr:hypothetical protein [Candidatus Angelobacter sp.]
MAGGIAAATLLVKIFKSRYFNTRDRLLRAMMTLNALGELCAMVVAEGPMARLFHGAIFMVLLLVISLPLLLPEKTFRA